VDPVPDPLLLRKSGSTGNRTQDLWVSSQELWPLDHRGGLGVHAAQRRAAYGLRVSVEALVFTNSANAFRPDLVHQPPDQKLLSVMRQGVAT
jgi:hypothetical protein